IPVLISRVNPGEGSRATPGDSQRARGGRRGLLLNSLRKRMIFWWAAGERIGGASAATISRGEAAYYFKSASTAATSGWPGTNPRVVRWTSSRPPISPSPCSAGYVGRSRQIRSATPPSFFRSATPPSFLSGKREVFLSRCAQQRASELLKLLLLRR